MVIQWYDKFHPAARSPVRGAGEDEEGRGSKGMGVVILTKAMQRPCLVILLSIKLCPWGSRGWTAGREMRQRRPSKYLHAI